MMFWFQKSARSGHDRTGRSIFCLSFIRSREIKFKTSRTSIQVKPGGKIKSIGNVIKAAYKLYFGQSEKFLSGILKRESASLPMSVTR